MTNLKDINFGINQYCGPAVLSALTGKSTDECAAVISSISGKKEIKAVDVNHLIKAFEKLRFEVKKVQSKSYTLYGDLTHLSSSGDAFYIILVHHHVVAIEVNNNSIFLIDNHSKHPVNAASSARLSQRVLEIYKIIPMNPPIFVSSYIRLSVTPNRIDIYNHSAYEDEKDNTKYSLGYIRFKDNLEFTQIIEALRAEVERTK